MKLFQEPIVPDIKYHDCEIYQDYGVSQPITILILGDKGVGRTNYISNFFRVRKIRGF